MKTYIIVTSLATALLVLGGAAPAPVHAAVVLTANNPNPTFYPDAQGKIQQDHIRVESDALLKPPYNSGAYELWLWVCPSDNPQGCRNTQHYTQYGAPCSGGSCSYLIGLKQPREVTIYFIAFVYEKASKRAVGQLKDSKVLAVTWKRGTSQQQPKPPDASRSLTLTVNGVTCTARHGPGGSLGEETAAGVAVVELQPDGSGRGPNIQAEMHHFPSSWPRLTIYWNGQTYTDTTTPACTGTSCTIQVNLPANSPGHPTQVVAETIYNEKLGPRDPTGGLVLAQLVCRVNVRFRKGGVLLQ